MRLDRSYVDRILRLTLLAPDIVDAIVAGREPSGLSLARLNNRLPLHWEDQRKRLGLPRREGYDPRSFSMAKTVCQ